MKTTVYRNEFHNYFNSSDTYKNQFSYEALDIIFDYIEEYEASTGDAVEFDLVSICCDFAESTLEEIISNYRLDIEDDGNQLNNVLDYLHDHTQVCGSYELNGDTFIIYGQF